MVPNAIRFSPFPRSHVGVVRLRHIFTWLPSYDLNYITLPRILSRVLQKKPAEKVYFLIYPIFLPDLHVFFNLCCIVPSVLCKKTFRSAMRNVFSVICFLSAFRARNRLKKVRKIQTVRARKTRFPSSIRDA